jgi:Lipid-A-disaccharide synthetase
VVFSLGPQLTGFGKIRIVGWVKAPTIGAKIVLQIIPPGARERFDMRSSTIPALRPFVIAGEESGDRLGGSLMAAVKALAPWPVAFRGIGGRAMAAQGLDSLFPLHDIAVNGFSAILARVPHLLRRIHEAVDAVIAAKPDVLVIIDSPGFTHRVARQVRTRAPHIPIVDYVSPQMWAWRPGRAVTMRAYVDHVLALWPFEPEAHRRLGGPPCTSSVTRWPRRWRRCGPVQRKRCAHRHCDGKAARVYRVVIRAVGQGQLSDGRGNDGWAENCALTSARTALWKRKKGRLA